MKDYYVLARAHDYDLDNTCYSVEIFEGGENNGDYVHHFYTDEMETSEVKDGVCRFFSESSGAKHIRINYDDDDGEVIETK